MAVQARIARHEDLKEVAVLCLSARTGLSHQRGGNLFGGNLGSLEEEDLLRRLHSDSELMLVATSGSELIGATLASELPLDRQGFSRVARLDVLYVDADHRRLGAATAMMSLVEDWARARQTVGIDTSALPGDRATKSFLEQLGYKARLLIMHKPLQP